MNKKFLFAALSLAALTACTNDDFEKQQIAVDESSPVKFEVINNAFTRASMDGNTVVWSATDGDLFTLYHGAAAPADGANLAAPYQNATYKANATDGSPASLSTPSMILQGSAIMVWPVDTTFRATIPANKLTIKIPVDQPADVQNQIPYVSDLINIGAYVPKDPDLPATYTNKAGYDRVYPIYMRPMASQLNLKTDYNGTDDKIAELYKDGADGLTGEDAVEEIKVESMELLTTPGGGGEDFTAEIPLKFKTKVAADNTRWNTAVPNNAWSHVTQFDVANIAAGGQTDKLTTECLTAENKGGKFLILPQAAIASGLDDAGVVVNTIYGKVVIANPAGGNPHGTKYLATEYQNAWYRYLPAAQKLAVATAEENASAATPDADGDNAGLYKTVAKDLSLGMQQTINFMSGYVRNDAASVVNTEPIGVALSRYVVVNLGHLDMSDLHIKNDKQLRDAARVWKKMGLTAVTVYLDGEDLDADGVSDFVITQKTIEVINTLNGSGLGFKVKPCRKAGEICDRIVITGSDYKQDVQNIAFIAANEDTYQADVVFANEGSAKPWKWNGKVLVTDAGVEKIINEGTMENAATATLQTWENGIGAPQNNIPFVNAKGATWNIKAPAILNVQFDVTNEGTVNIAKGAQYRQDGRAFDTRFTNEAYDLPSRFGGDDSEIGVVNNSGVFATVAKTPNTAEIDNFGLIEHADKDAKTFITHNQTYKPTYKNDANFSSPFLANSTATPSLDNKMGRINLPYSNKDEDNVSISAALNQGFVSVTIDGEVTGTLTNTALGTKVNYVIIKSGVTNIADLAQVDYLEVNSPGTEIAWSVATPTAFDGLMVLSDVNIKLGTTVTVNKATYLGADMYVGGTFTNAGYAGYYGDTSANEATKYITY